MDEHTGRRRFSLSGMGLRIWGLVFLAVGTCGRAVIQNTLMGLNQKNTAEILDALEQSTAMLQFATVAVVFQAVEACAAPIFAFLLVEGFRHTSDFKKYLLRVAGLAFFCEIPFNLAAGGSWLVPDNRNPVFAMVICLIMLYFYGKYQGRSLNNILIQCLVTLTACLWVDLLQIQDGVQLVLLTAVIWFFRDRTAWRTLVGCGVACLCGVISPFYFAAPLSFLLIFLYAGEQGTDQKLISYTAYPAILLLFYGITLFLR